MAGAPPFGVFVSEFLILTAAVQAGLWLVAALLVLLLVVIFGGFLAHVLRMSHGPAPHPGSGEPSRMGSALVWAFVGLATLPGLWIPGVVQAMLQAAARALAAG